MPEKSKPKKKVNCPRCGQELDDRGDGVLVCIDCGYEEPATKKD